MTLRLLKPAAILLLGLASNAMAIEGPPVDENGVIGNPTLKANQSVANLQAVGVISTFMTEGATDCDAEGKNCRSLFGNDDSMDMATLQFNASSMLGTSGYSLLTDKDAASISTQSSTMAIACGDNTVHVKSGIALKLVSCTVATNGDTRLSAQVCSAPLRGLPVTEENPDTVVDCSDNPTSPDYLPPQGFSCRKATCDDSPEGSLNGWSAPFDVRWTAALPDTASDSEKSNNGLALVFYPALGANITPSFSADSDNMTAVKVVQSYYNTETLAAAVGLRVVYRFKAQMSKDQLATGAGVTNPSEHSAQWDTLVKLQANPLITQYQAKYAANGTECLTQIQDGLANTGVVSVCDRNYVNESGIRPGALEATVISEGEKCDTATTTCLNEVVNTNTWTESCFADVPLALRTCTTTTDYQIENVSYTRTRTTEICTENRPVAQYSCTTESVVDKINPGVCPNGAVLVDTAGYNACGTGCDDPYQHFKLTCGPDDTIHINWYTLWWDWSPAFTVVNQTITQKAFETGSAVMPAYCFDGSGNVFLDTVCTDTTCVYNMRITGNCPGNRFTAQAVAPINYQAEYGIRNGCSIYETAR